MSQEAVDRAFMAQALALARKGGTAVEPNPRVGAVIVRGDEVVGEGYHAEFGGPHAEVNALATCVEPVTEATLYVTLEPCCFHGKTPACTDLIWPDSFRRVVVAAADPNPRVAGRGMEVLRERRMAVEVGVMESEARDLNRAYYTFHEKQRPYVTLKYASTLDGFLAEPNGRSQWITSQATRQWVHELRTKHQAILVGWKTVAADDPALTSHGLGRDPRIFIVDAQQQMPVGATVRSNGAQVFIKKAEEGTASDNTIPVLQADPQANVMAMLAHMYQVGIQSLFVEGGGETLTHFLEAGLYDELRVFLAPKFLGTGLPVFRKSKTLADAWPLTLVDQQPIGNDILLTYHRND